MEEILEINNKKWGQELQQRNKEIAEIQEAYKEKNRKCQAWEKVAEFLHNINIILNCISIHTKLRRTIISGAKLPPVGIGKLLAVEMKETY